MSLNILELKESIMSTIKDNEYSIDDLKDFLGPIMAYIDAPIFVMYLKEVVEEILRDRDGSGHFNLDDLRVLKDDILGITTLVNAILLVVGAVPEFKLKYEAGVTEELIFKILAYIFLLVVPKETGHPWSLGEKEKVVDLILSLYNVIRSSQTTKDILEKIAQWFQKKGYCKCLSDEETNEEIVEEHMPEIKANLGSSLQKCKDITRMDKELQQLRAEITKLRSNN